MTQQAMHHEADPFLGYMTMNDRHFYARERSPYKKKLKAEKLLTPTSCSMCWTAWGGSPRSCTPGRTRMWTMG